MESNEQTEDLYASSNIVLQNSSDVHIVTTNLLDQIPVGGGTKKFNMSQYPDQNAPLKPSLKRLAMKKKKEEPVLVQENTNRPQQTPITSNNFNNPSQYDQKPIGKSNFNISEYAEGEEAPPPAASKNLTLEQKLKSKAIKIRMEGLDQLLEAIQNNPIDELPVTDLNFDKLLKQSNPACLEKAVMSFKQWINKNGNYQQEEIKQLIQNGYINGKGNTKQVSFQMIDSIYQVKNTQCQAALVNGLKGKNMKIVTGYITTINELLAIYGIKRMNYLKPYLPDVIKIISNQKLPALKTQGMNMLRDAMKWLGAEFLEPQFKTHNLKQGLKKELDAFWETYDKTIVMTAPKNIVQSQSKNSKGGKGLDVYDISDAVDIFKKFNEKWVETVIKTEKWNQKTKLMQQLISAASVPKIANTDSRHIVDLIKRHINDSNMNVVLCTLKIIGCMAKGLRKTFTPVIRQFFSSVLNKFKQKKTQMIDQTNNCLADCYFCLNLEELIDDIKEGLSDKNPNMKINTLNWIASYLEKKQADRGQIPDKTRDAVKNLIPVLDKLVNDGAADVRETNIKLIAKLKGYNIGEGFSKDVEAKLQKVMVIAKPQAKKLSTIVQFEKKELLGGNKQPDKNNMDSPHRRIPTTIDISSSAQPSIISVKSTKNQSVNLQKKQTIALNNNNNSNNNNNTSYIKPPEVNEDVEVPSFQECCQMLIDNGFDEVQFKKVTSTNAKEKQKLIQMLQQHQQVKFEYLLKIFRKIFKDWKQSNLIMNKQLINYLAHNTEKINKRQYILILPFLLDKLGDNKFLEPLETIKSELIAKISPKFIVNQILKYVAKQTQAKKINPKLNSQICSFIAEIIDKVSLNYIPFKQTVQFTKECFNVTLSKKGAVVLLKKMYEYLGQQLKICLDQSIIKSLDPEFKKTQILQNKAPKITFRGDALEQVKREKIVSPLDSLPKADISNDVNRLLPKITDMNNWQNRKDGIQQLSRIISQNQNRIQVNGLTQLFTVLKTRVNDSNKSLAKLFVAFTGQLFEAIGKQGKPHAKPLIYSLVEILSDKTEAIRKQSLNALNKISMIVGIQNILSCMSQPLQTDKVQLRTEILNFILNNVEGTAKLEAKDFVKGTINCLCDRNKDIRNLSQKLLEILSDKIGMETFRTVAKDYRAAFSKDLNILFDKYDKSSPVQKKTPQKKEIIHSSLQQPPQQQQQPQLVRTMTLKNIHEKDMIQSVGVQPLQQSHELVPFFNSNEDVFANLKFLVAFKQHRIERQSISISSTISLIDLTTKEEDFVVDDLSKILRKDLVNKMLGFDYRKSYEISGMLIKYCRDVNYYNHIKQSYDILIKWIYFRIFGGSGAEYGLIQLLPQITAVLEKKNVLINESEIIYIIGVFREFLCSSVEAKPLELYLHTMKSLTKLNSGDRILRLLLKQYLFDINRVHKHLPKQINKSYRQYINKIIRLSLLDFIGNQQILLEIAKIRELSYDRQFVDCLYMRFNERILNQYKFNRVFEMGNPPGQQTSVVPPSNKIPSLNIGGLNQNINTNMNNGELRASTARNPINTNFTPPPIMSGPIVTQNINPNNNFSQVNNNLPPNKNSFQPIQNFPPTSPQQPQQLPMQIPPSQQSLKKIVPPVTTQIQEIPQRIQTPIETRNQMPINLNNTLNNASLLLNQSLNSSMVSSDPPQKPLITRLNFSSYAYPHPSDLLSEHLTNLIPTKGTPNDATINFFSHLFSQDKNIPTLEGYAKIIVASLLKSIFEMLDKRNQYLPDKIVIQLGLLQQALKNKLIIRNIHQVLAIATEFVLKQLVYEDENKVAIGQSLRERKIDYDPKEFIKVINRIMLRILQNAHPHQLLVILYDLLIRFMKKNQSSQKTISLIIKCASKVAQNYKSDEFQEEHLKELFLIFNRYCNQLQGRLKPEDQGIVMMKNLLTEITKQLNSNIWIIYDKSIRQKGLLDQVIAPHLQSLNIPEPIQPKQNREQELRKITQFLSKFKTYEAGIQLLNSFLDHNPDFQIVQYFNSLNYENKFISKVMNSLESFYKNGHQVHQEKKNMVQSIADQNIQQNDNQNKMKAIKQKLQEFRDENQSVNTNIVMNNNPSFNPQMQIEIPQQQQQQQPPPPSRESQIRKRIAEMKAKARQNHPNNNSNLHNNNN